MTARLAIIGDLHYSVDALDNVSARSRNEFYDALLNSFFSCDADFHIALGDLTHFGTEAEWLQLVDLVSHINGTYQRNFRYILGNHDTLEVSKQRVAEITRLPRFFMEELNSCKCAFIDTTYEASPKNWGGFVDDEQLEWLSQQPIETERPLLLFGHHPLPRTTLESEKPMMSIDNGHELAQRVQPIGYPIVYFNGHNHIHNIVNQLNSYPNWTFVQSSAVLSAPVYRVVTVDSNQITIDTVDLSAAVSASHFRNNVQGYFHQQSAFGKPADHNIEITMNH